MHIQADRFLALTAMLAGFVPTGPNEERVGERGVDESADSPAHAHAAAAARVEGGRDHRDACDPCDPGAEA